jgi:hypothetical protein
VSLNPVPNNNDLWTGENSTPIAPYEAQFLKVYDVTPPAGAVSVSPSTGLTYNATPELVMTVDTSGYDAHDNVVAYEIVVSDANSSWTDTATVSGTGAFTWPVNTEAYGRTVTVTVTPVSVAGVLSAQSTQSGPILVLDPSGDEDSNGMSNYQEFVAGTDPTNPLSVLRAENIALSGANSQVSFTGVAGRRYRLEYSEDFLAGAAEPTWVVAGDWVSVALDGEAVDLQDPEADTPSRIYRIVVERVQLN